MKMRTDYRCVIIAAALLVFLTPMVGHACSCVSEVCNTAWRHGQVVFLGEVTSKEIIPRAATNTTESLTFSSN